MEKVSNRIIEQLIQREILQSDCLEQLEAYSYIIGKRLSQLITLLALVLFSIVTETYLTTLILAWSCFTLRKVVGGFHMPSRWSCFLLTMLVVGGAALGIEQIHYSLYTIISVSLAVLSFLIVWHKAPSIHENEWHSEETQKSMKEKSRVYASVFTLFVLIISVTQWIATCFLSKSIPVYWLKSSTAVAFGLMLASSSVLINSIQNKMRKE